MNPGAPYDVWCLACGAIAQKASWTLIRGRFAVEVECHGEVARVVNAGRAAVEREGKRMLTLFRQPDAKPNKGPKVERTRRPRQKWPREKANRFKSSWNYTCLCCGDGMNPDKLHLDHVVPHSLGGSNRASNFQPLCARCGQKKGTRIVDFRLCWTLVGSKLVELTQKAERMALIGLQPRPPRKEGR